MSDYFDLLEVELRAAVPRAVKAPARARRRLHLGNGTAPALLGAAVALAVVVIAVLLVGHVNRAPQSAAPKPKSGTADAVPTLGQLLDNFVTLRRAQTAADRAWQPSLSAGLAVRKLPERTRLARTLPNGDRVFLTIEQLRTAQLGHAAGTYSMNVWMVPQSGPSVGTAYGPSGGYMIFPSQWATGGQRTGRGTGSVWMSVVPDGVGAVRWTFPCRRARTARCTHATPVTLTVPVRGNVAVASVPGTGTCRASAARCLQPATVVWYGSLNRQVVARYASAHAAAITAPPFVLKPARPPVNGIPPRPAWEMLSGGGIAGISFGQLRTTTVAALDRVLGVRGGNPRSARGDCGLGSSITWRSGAGQPPLTAYFAHGRLVGYEYGNFGDQVPGGSNTQGPKLGTPRGLTVDDTVEVGRRLYGSAFTVSPAQGGTFKAATATGQIVGYLSGVPQPSTTNQLRVVTIDAGTVGCPAVTP